MGWGCSRWDAACSRFPGKWPKPSRNLGEVLSALVLVLRELLQQEWWSEGDPWVGTGWQNQPWKFPGVFLGRSCAGSRDGSWVQGYIQGTGHTGISMASAAVSKGEVWLWLELDQNEFGCAGVPPWCLPLLSLDQHCSHLLISWWHLI